ncbi:MAG: Transcriptional regulator, ArsR family, partial [uncultured Solirubrobacterales bacterium]
GSVSVTSRLGFRSARGPHAQGHPRAARPGQREPHRARRAVRDVADRTEEARADPRGCRARHDREGRSDSPVPPRPAPPGGRPAMDRGLPVHAGRSARSLRGAPRTEKRRVEM